MKLSQNLLLLELDFQNITSRVIRSISRKEWSAALGVFSALKHINLLQPDIEKTCNSMQRQQLGGVLNKFNQTAGKALERKCLKCYII